MEVTGIDERHMVSEHAGGNFIIYIYEGGDDLHRSWSVDSYLLTEADLPSAFKWLSQNLPEDCCWSLGVVQHPDRPTSDSEVSVAWVVGADVLNISPSDRDPEEQRLADEMVSRRHRLTL